MRNKRMSSAVCSNRSLLRILDANLPDKTKDAKSFKTLKAESKSTMAGLTVDALHRVTYTEIIAHSKPDSKPDK